MSEEITTSPFLRPDEKILMIVHRHTIMLLYHFLFLMILLITTVVVLMMSGSLIGMFGTALFWGCLALYWIFFLTFIMMSWMHDELDLFIVTDSRLIGIDQVGPLTRRVTECGLDQVQEVNAEVSGIFQTLFRYGHINIHTASETSDMVVRYAPNPIETANKLDIIISEFKKGLRQ